MISKLFLLFSFTISLVLVVRGQAVDDTLTPRSTGWDVSQAVVKKVKNIPNVVNGSSSLFPHDQNLLRRIAYVESQFGESDKTYRPGYFGGIWQLDEDKFNRTKNATSLNTVYSRLIQHFGIYWNTTNWNDDLLKPLHSGLAARMYLHTLTQSGLVIPGTITDQANFWVTHFRPNGTAAEFVRLVRLLESDEQGQCEGLMDLCIVLDGSSSIGSANFDKAKNFTAQLVSSFNLADEKTRVAFVLYSTNVQTIFGFNNTHNSTTMQQTILNMIYPNARTNTPGGLIRAVELFEASPARNTSGVPKIVATFTDGNSNEGNLPTALQRVRAANLTSFGIGIGGDISQSQLLQIALNRPENVLTVTNYEALAEFFHQMNQVACEVPQEPELGQEQNGTLGTNEKRYFKFRIPSIGFTLHLKVGSAKLTIKGWYSYTESTPSSALYDGAITSAATFIPPRSRNGRQGSGSDEVYITLQNVEEAADYVLTTEEGNTVPNSGDKFTKSSILMVVAFLVKQFM